MSRAIANIDSKSLTRRTAVLSLAAVAVPSAVLAFPLTVDPIYSAIAAHREAYAAFGAHLSAMDSLGEGLPPEVMFGYATLDTGVVVDGTPLKLRTDADIDALFTVAERDGMSREDGVRGRAILRERFDKEMENVVRQRDESGWTSARQLESEVGHAERVACDAMIATVPTTREGLAALLDYVVEEQGRDELLDADGLFALVATAAHAVRAPIN